jgi:hypothetical protein
MLSRLWIGRVGDASFLSLNRFSWIRGWMAGPLHELPELIFNPDAAFQPNFASL